jgi:hypothetical protein
MAISVSRKASMLNSHAPVEAVIEPQENTVAVTRELCGALAVDHAGFPSIALEYRVMKTTVFVVSIVAALMMASTSSAGAKGCIKGAIVGGVAGHYAGHHGVLGAAAGCLYGRHHAKEQARHQQEQQQNHDAQGKI